MGQPTIWANQTSVAVVAALAGNLALVLSGLFLTNIDKIKGGKSEKYQFLAEFLFNFYILFNAGGTALEASFKCSAWSLQFLLQTCPGC